MPHVSYMFAGAGTAFMSSWLCALDVSTVRMRQSVGGSSWRRAMSRRPVQALQATGFQVGSLGAMLFR